VGVDVGNFDIVFVQSLIGSRESVKVYQYDNRGIMDNISGRKVNGPDDDAAQQHYSYPLSPSAKQTISPMTSPRESPSARHASPSAKSSHNVSPTRYNLRFVTSSPGTSSPHAKAKAGAADGGADDDPGTSLHGESIAFDLRGLTTQSPSGSPTKSSQLPPSGPSASPSSYVIRPRRSSSDSKPAQSPRGGANAAVSSPSNSEGGRDGPNAGASYKSSSAAAASPAIGFITPQEPGGKTDPFYDPFSGAPTVPPLTPMNDVVELTPTVEAAVKAARMVGEQQRKRMVDPSGGRSVNSKGDIWASKSFRSVVDSADCVLAVELGDRNYLKQRYEDAIECYEEGLEQAYMKLHSTKRASESRTSASGLVLDDVPSDEEGGGPAAERMNPLSPDEGFLERIGDGSVLQQGQADIVLIAFASVCLREGNSFFRLGDWKEASRAYSNAKGYLALIKAAVPARGEETEGATESSQSASASNRAAMLSKTKMEGQIMNNMAAIEASLGKHQHATTEYAESLRVKRRALRSMLKQEKDTLGAMPLSKEDAVLDITTTLTNIGLLRQKLTKFSKAEDAYKQALSLRVEKCGERDLSVASALYRMGDLYFLQGKFDRALRSYNEVLSTHKKLGADDPQAATMLFNIGLIYYRIGPYSKAKSSLKQALKIKKAQQAEASLDIAATYHLLGVVLTAMGQFDSAMKCLVSSLRIRQKELGESSSNHLSILNTRLAIGEVHRHQGKLDEAMVLFRLVCEGRIKRLGFNHEATAEAVQCIGLALREKGDLDEAISMLDKSLTVRRTRLGSSSPLVAETLVHLSGCYFKQRKLDEASAASDEALRIASASFGEDHIMYSNSLKSTADLQQARGQFDDSLTTYSQVLRIKDRWLGSTHVECGDIHNSVGNAKFKMGDYSGAKEAFTKALEIKRASLDACHTSLYTTLNNLGHAHYKSRDLDGALDMYEQSLQCQMRRLCARKDDTESEEFDFLSHLQHVVKKVDRLSNEKEEMDQITFALGNVASTLRNIGLVKQDQSNLEEALEVYGYILTVRKAMPTVDQAAVALTAETIGMLHFKQGNHNGALSAFGEALNVKEMTQGTQTLDYARTLNNLANVHFSSGNLDQAMELYQRALAIKKNQLGEDHDEVANTQNNVAHLLFTLGRDEECLEAYNEVLRMRQNKFGPDHLAVGATLSNIGDLHVKMENPHEAVVAFKDSVRIRKMQQQKNPADIADIARALESLASASGKMGDWKQARNAYKESLRLKKLAYVEDHEEVIKTLDLLAMSLIEQGLFKDATEPVKEALELRRKRFGQNHDEVVSQLNALAFLYKKAGDDDSAARVFAEISAGADAELDDSPRSTM